MGRFFRSGRDKVSEPKRHFRQRLQQRQQNENHSNHDGEDEATDNLKAVKIVITNNSSGEEEVQTSHLPPNAANIVIVSNEHIETPGDVKTSQRDGEIVKGTPPASTIAKNVLKLSTKTPRISNMASVTHPPHSSHHHHLSAASVSSHTTSGCGGGGVSRKLPGVFTLIEQGNWARATERAKKYPFECRKWATIKRKQSSVTSHFPSSSSSATVPTSPQIANNLSSASSITSATSSFSVSTLKSTSSSTSATTATIANQAVYASVTCKALHHACLRLNNVHSQIRNLISITINEINYIQETVNNNKSHHHNQLPPSNSPSFSSPQSPAHSERKTTIDSLSPCASACNVTEGLSFDESSENDNSVEIAGRISPTFGRFVKYVKGSIPSSNTTLNHNHHIDEDEVWDDPWIEACKAILTIIEICPEAAQQRESRHGCLPIHLAAFAMCPTPHASLPKDYAKFKHYLNSNNGYYPCSTSTSSPQTPKQTQEGIINHKEAIATSHSEQQHHINSNSDDIAALPPRPLQLLRGKSSSSAASCASVNSSVDGFSAALNEGGGSCSIGATSSTSELSDILVAMEEKLRINQNSLKPESDGSCLTKEEEVKLLERCTRPRAILGFHDRGSSIESANSCGNSINSGASTAMQAGSSPKVKYRTFYLDKYIDNAERREEYSLKVINALLNAYKKGATKDSEGGRLPLHTALTGRATFKVLETLIAAYPPACRHRTKEGSLPLHLAAHYGVSDERIAPMLLRHYPDSSVGKNKYERTPFEEGLLMGGENGREHQEKLMEALRKPSFYWISDAVSRIAPRSIFDYTDINEILKGEGTGIEKRMASVDDDSEDNNNDDDLVSLIKRQEWVLITEKIDLFTPFIQAPFQAAVRAGYNAKVSALHLTCEQNPTYEVLDALVSACPGAITWRMFPYGELPLHVAATWKASSSVIGFLIAANPLATKQVDGWGNLPLHCACFSGASEETVESLLCVHPKAVNVKNIQGSRPRDIVRRLSHRNKKTVLDLIDRVSLELLKKKRQRKESKALPADISNCGYIEAGREKYKLSTGHEHKNEQDQQVRTNPTKNNNGMIERASPLDREEMLWV